MSHGWVWASLLLLATVGVVLFPPEIAGIAILGNLGLDELTGIRAEELWGEETMSTGRQTR